jgi:hypothetical protein
MGRKARNRLTVTAALAGITHHLARTDGSTARANGPSGSLGASPVPYQQQQRGIRHGLWRAGGRAWRKGGRLASVGRHQRRLSDIGLGFVPLAVAYLLSIMIRAWMRLWSSCALAAGTKRTAQRALWAFTWNTAVGIAGGICFARHVSPSPGDSSGALYGGTDGATGGRRRPGEPEIVKRVAYIMFLRHTLTWRGAARVCVKPPAPSRYRAVVRWVV